MFVYKCNKICNTWLIASVAHQFSEYIWHFVVGNILLIEYCQTRCRFYDVLADKEHVPRNFVEHIARREINEISWPLFASLTNRRIVQHSRQILLRFYEFFERNFLRFVVLSFFTALSFYITNYKWPNSLFEFLLPFFNSYQNCKNCMKYIW